MCPVVLAFHVGTSLYPNYSTSDIASYLWPGKATEDGLIPWALAPKWETWKKL